MLDYNTTVVLTGTGLLGVAAGVTGSFAVLRQRALLGDALAHAALPGICLAFLLFQKRSLPVLLTGAFVSAIVAMVVVSFITKNSRTKQDAAIGIVLSVFFGAGIVLLKTIQNTSTEGSKAGLHSFILGKTAGMVAEDVYAIALLVLFVLVSLWLFYKEFKLVSFDADFAAVQGWPAVTLDFMILVLLTVTIVLGLPAVGVVLMAAMLILPAAAARFWTEQLWLLLVLAGVLGGLAGISGTLLSSGTTSVDLPAGPTIVLVGSTFFAFSMGLAPQRGILARAIRHLRLRRKIERQNFLRAAYELIEPQLGRPRQSFSIEAIARHRGWSDAQARRALHKAQRGGLAESDDDRSWEFTSEGFRRAASVARTHRLWELYLIEYADIAADHVDRDADMIEHLLSTEILEELERELERSGRLPPSGEIPLSPHHLEAEP